MAGVHSSVVLETIDQDFCRPERIAAVEDYRGQLCVDSEAIEHERADQCRLMFCFHVHKRAIWEKYGQSYQLMLDT